MKVIKNKKKSGGKRIDPFYKNVRIFSNWGYKVNSDTGWGGDHRAGSSRNMPPAKKKGGGTPAPPGPTAPKGGR